MSSRDAALTLFTGIPIVMGLLRGLTGGQKTVMEYGKLSNRQWQGSEYGGDIPRVYGTVGLKGSQIIWLEKNKLKEVVKKKKSGGKGGGGGTTTKTYTYFATFALALCEGEIAGIRRIWCSDKLIYNAGSDDLETIIASNQAAKGWRLYRGTDDQMPDSRMEADIGVGRTPAYRGLAYLVFDDFALADYSNTLQAAQFKIEVLSALDLGDPVLSTNSSLENIRYPVFQSGSSVASCLTYINGPGDSYQVYEHFLGKKQYKGIQDRTGFTGDPPRRVIGASEVALVKTGRNGFLLDWKLYSTTKFGEAWFYFDIAYDKGADAAYILAQSSSSTKLVAITPDGEFEAGRTDLLSICLHDGFVYGIRVNEIVKFSARDLEEVSAVPISPFYSIHVGPWVYIQVHDGKLYLFPYMDVTTPSGKALQVFDVKTGTLLSVVNNFPGATYVGTFGAASAIYDGVIFQCARAGSTPGINIITFDQVISERLALGDVVISEMSLSGLIQPGDVDVSLLTQQVTGYRIPGGTVRSSIEPLQGAYPFDVIQSGYKLKCVPRGQSSLTTIPWEDLAANDGGELGDMLSMPREMDTQLPQRVSITALSSNREYASSTQYAERLNTQAVNVEQRDIPLVLSDDEVAQMADKLLYLRWLERTDAELSLPPSYLGLEPADVVTAVVPYGMFELRLTEINYEADGRLTCKAKPNNAAIYTSNAAGAQVPGPDGAIPLAGPSILLTLDIPVVDETLQNAPGFVGVMAGYTEGWPGGLAVRSADSGQTWTDLQAFTGMATMGTARNTLPASSGTLIEQRSLTVDLLSGEIESITRGQMLLGMNYAAYGADRRWEIVRFQSAVLQVDGSYVVSGFVRGDRGTEWATGLHQAGDYFVLLDDPDNVFIDMAVGSIGVPAVYRGVTSGASIDSASDVPFTYQGVNLECLSPVYAKGSRDGSGNFSGSFTRRSRLSSSWWTNGVEAPLGETSQAYEIDVMSGSTVKRTITASTPAFSYSATDQASDFGSAQSSINFRIYQLSATVGRGAPLEATL